MAFATRKRIPVELLVGMPADMAFDRGCHGHPPIREWRVMGWAYPTHSRPCQSVQFRIGPLHCNRVRINEESVMKAAVVTSNGVQIQDAPVPKPTASQVLVRVRACGLNRADLAVAAGRAHGSVGGAGT